MTAIITSLTDGGTAGLLWGFIVVVAGFYLVYLSIAEMASMAPTSGGQYHWWGFFFTPFYLSIAIDRIVAYPGLRITSVADERGCRVSEFAPRSAQKFLWVYDPSVGGCRFYSLWLLSPLVHCRQRLMLALDPTSLAGSASPAGKEPSAPSATSAAPSSKVSSS